MLTRLSSAHACMHDWYNSVDSEAELPCAVSLPQIIEWYEEYAEEFFQTHTELGESLEVALALEQEVKQFEESTQVSRL